MIRQKPTDALLPTQNASYAEKDPWVFHLKYAELYNHVVSNLYD